MNDEKEVQDKINNNNFVNMFAKMFLPKTKEEYIKQLRKNEDRMKEIKNQVSLELLINNLCYLISKDKNISYEDAKSAWDNEMNKGIEMCLKTIADMLYEEVEK